MIADADISPVAALLGEPARARMVSALNDGRALPAGELARCAGVSPSTASDHLARLVEGRLLAVERAGRHRYYRVASAEVARAIEALAAIAPPTPVTSLRQAAVGEALAAARTCYDHLAGRLGVAITDRLLEGEALVAHDDEFALGPQARAIFGALGVDVASLPPRRPAALRCLDWSERRPHVAGAVGAAVLQQALERRWVTRVDRSRAVRLTEAGERALTAALGGQLTLVR